MAPDGVEEALGGGAHVVVGGAPHGGGAGAGGEPHGPCASRPVQTTRSGVGGGSVALFEG